MALVAGREVLTSARAANYGIGAFNCHSLDVVRAIVEVAVQERAPVILQFTEESLSFMGWEPATALAVHVAREAPVPVVLHLDHASSLDSVTRAVHLGFTSVMIDGSHLPFEENVALTRQVVAIARPAGVSVEAEIGRVGGADENREGDNIEGAFTEPEDAERFYRETAVDYLAVSFGTVHGITQRVPQLDLDRLREIAERVPVPLVMHGGSGIPEALLSATLALGIAKVNISSELKIAWTTTLRETLARLPAETDPCTILAPARSALQAVVREKIRVLRTSGRG